MFRHSSLLALLAAVGGAGALAFACSNPQTNSLGDEFGGPTTTTPEKDSAADDTMVANTDPIDSDIADAAPDVDSAPNPITAQSLFAALLPNFESTCGQGGNGCHASSTSGAPTWLLGPDQYASLHTYDSMQSGALKFITPDILSSRFFTKGAHEGPALDPTSAFGKQIQIWLQYEVNLQASIASATTVPVVVVAGENTIDLSPLMTGTVMTGASLSFVATFRGTALDVGNLKITAPANMEIHISLPQFVHIPQNEGGAPEPDPDNQFSNVDQTTTGTSPLGPGVAIFAWTWNAGDLLAVQVKTLQAAAIPDASDAAVTSCSALSTFVSSALPALTASYGGTKCLNCHNTGGSGNSALDLSMLGMGDESAACSQVYSKIDPKKPGMSLIISTPEGAAGHPFTIPAGNQTSFTNGLTTWINAEK